MPDPRIISPEYKQRFKDLTEQLGRVPNTLDSEYWQLTEWYKDQYDQERIIRLKEEAYERAQEKKRLEKLEKTGEIEPPKYIKRICQTCPNEILPTGKRGRPAQICPTCKSRKGK